MANLKIAQIASSANDGVRAVSADSIYVLESGESSVGCQRVGSDQHTCRRCYHCMHAIQQMHTVPLSNLQATIPAPVTTGFWVRVDGSKGKPERIQKAFSFQRKTARNKQRYGDGGGEQSINTRFKFQEYLHERVGTFQLWKEDERLQEPSAA